MANKLKELNKLLKIQQKGWLTLMQKAKLEKLYDEVYR
jgi:hypothetical protein